MIWDASGSNKKAAKYLPAAHYITLSYPKVVYQIGPYEISPLQYSYFARRSDVRTLFDLLENDFLNDLWVSRID